MVSHNRATENVSCLLNLNQGVANVPLPAGEVV